MRKITFDIETSNIFSEVASNNARDLDLSVICIHDSETGEYSSYKQEELSKLWPIMEKADMLITFNGDHFDIPLLDKYYPGDLTQIKSLDLLKEVRASLGRRIKLDTLAQATLGSQKSGNGLDAVTWWRNGEYEKVIKYCIDDVKITKQIYEYARKNNSLKYLDLPSRNVKEFKLDASNWEEKEDHIMTHTLF
ncbi:hypothetical protein COB55_00830 [Candidatus Wolfebacteria bacterium]|nr:MAG: hypothetical protein COB55_00830 [Candidatus Wolfebacteria bacterium]